MPKPHRFVAVDTEVLLALEAGDEECAGVIDHLSTGGFYCLVTETPLQELGDIAQLASDLEAAKHAKATLVQITNFGFLQPRLSSVEMGIALRVAHKVKETFHSKGTVNDGLVIAEAAYNKCQILLTRRSVLLSAKVDSLQITLIDSDLSPVVVASPVDILSYYGSSKSRR